MITKKLIHITVLLAIVISCVCTATAQTIFGVRAGVNYATITSPKAKTPKMEYTPGFHIGVLAETPIAEGLYVQPGLLFTSKGHKATPMEGVVYNEQTYYVELPVNVIYKIQAGTGKLLLGAGPYGAYGLSGQGKYAGEPNDGEKKITFKKNGERSDNVINYRPFDAGINTLVGYELSDNIFLQLNAQFGLVDFFNDNSSAFTKSIVMHNQVFGLSFGYKF